jgi:hypothetical protein
VKSTIHSVLRVSPDTFWERIFFDPPYVEALHAHLGFETFAVTTLETLPGGCVRRVARAVPPLHAPAAIKKQLDNRLTYTDDGTFDPVKREWTFRTIPGVFADAVYVGGRIYLEPHEQGATHICEIEARVSVFGIGSLIERILDRNTRQSFAVTARFTNDWAERQSLLHS